MDVVELFAGVGGFRLGLEPAGHKVVWWNQWEPMTSRVQHAYNCYARTFHHDFVGPLHPSHNTSIQEIDAKKLPDHHLLVGGFPCQDYSVASPLRHSKGLRGKKGGLWWDINRILETKRPPYVLLENVDRLLRSPRTRRGHDFSVLLASLARLGYMVEWRVLNAADYGQPQRRRRVFIFAARSNTVAGKFMRANASRVDYLTRYGFFAKPFPVVQEPVLTEQREPSFGKIGVDPREVSSKRKFLDFANAGVMAKRRVWTMAVDPVAQTPRPSLRSVLKKGAAEQYYVPKHLHKQWKKYKDEKDLQKLARGGYTYRYQEGALPFPDDLKGPARTLLTCEGSVSPSRSNHIIRDPWTKRYRILTPEECELLMGFPEGHTKSLPRRWRYFTMGNALMVGLVRMMGERLNSFVVGPHLVLVKKKVKRISKLEGKSDPPLVTAVSGGPNRAPA